MRRFLMVAGIVVLVMTGIFAWRNIPRIDTYTIEKSPFDPNTVCLFWTEYRDTPDPDSKEVTRSRASFWLDVGSGKIARAENPHPTQYNFRNSPGKPVISTIRLEPDEIPQGDNYSYTERYKDELKRNRVIWYQNNEHKVLYDGRVSSLSWSSDGHKVAISVSTSGGSLVLIVDENGKILRNIPVENEFTGNDPIQWSPDGKYISVQVPISKSDSNDSGAFILIVKIEDGNTIRTATIWNIVGFERHYWAENGKLFAIHYREKDAFRVEFIDPEKGLLRRHEWSHDPSYGTNAFPSPNLQYIALLHGEPKTSDVVGVDGTVSTITSNDINNVRWLDENRMLYVDYSRDKNKQVISLALMLWDNRDRKPRLISELNNGGFGDHVTYFKQSAYLNLPNPSNEYLGKFAELDLKSLEMKLLPLLPSGYWYNQSQTRTIAIYQDSQPFPSMSGNAQYVLMNNDLIHRTRQEYRFSGDFWRPNYEIESSDWVVLSRTAQPAEQNFYRDIVKNFLGKGSTHRPEPRQYALYNVRTNEFKLIGTGFFVLPRYLLVDSVGTDRNDRSNIIRSGAFFAFVDLVKRNEKWMQQYTVYGQTGTEISSYIIEPFTIYANTFIWRYAILLSPDYQSALFSNEHSEPVKRDNQDVNSEHHTAVYVGHSEKTTASLLEDISNKYGDTVIAYWSPDSKYFVVEYEPGPQIPIDLGPRRHFLKLYNADGTLRWERETALFQPGNVAIQYCGEPFPRDMYSY